MDPLEAVEVLLGAVDSWPTYIIRYLFTEDPHARAMRNVADLCMEMGYPLTRLQNAMPHVMATNITVS
jgi:hypothetical protein